VLLLELFGFQGVLLLELFGFQGVLLLELFGPSARFNRTVRKIS